MRTVAAACLHEGFLITQPEEDIKKLQQTLCELLEEDNKDIILALIPNIKTLIERYCNEHALSLLPDAPAANGDSTPTKGGAGSNTAGGFGLAHSNTLVNKIMGNDFSSMHRKIELGSGKQYGGAFKKLPSAHNLHMGGSAAHEAEE